MTRIPLRPLARILPARDKGENPDAIERENLRLRHEQMRDGARARAEGRILVLGLAFLAAFATVGVRMGAMASSEPAEPRASASGAQVVAQRGDIVDRRGRLLATNIDTHALYAHPHQMVNPIRAAEELVEIFPDLDIDRLKRDFTGSRKFMWIKKKISPEQQQAVHDIGEPGLLFGPREMRLYPNGKLAAHILGGTSFGNEGVASAEVIGTAGIERQFDSYLRDPANAEAPLQLSLDLTVQAAVERVLGGGMRLMDAKGATAVLMEVRTGEIIAMSSIPDFDPNDRPPLPTEGHPDDSPLFNRAVQGIYELGSTFKIFTVAQALELNLVKPETIIDTKGPISWGRFRISDFHNYGNQMTVSDIIRQSSNIGTARIAQQIGGERQQDFLRRIGLMEPTPVELSEAGSIQPMVQKNWSDLTTMTVSYGHGMAISPLHLAAAYAIIANDGLEVPPTLVKRSSPPAGERVLSAEVAAQAQQMLRLVVSEGTASFGNVAGYEVAGKTGTADKQKPSGGYYENRVIATFATMFPASDPQYVLVVTLDEPEIFASGEDRRSAGWTAVPVAAEMITRIAPLLGLRPRVEPAEGAGITLTSN